MRLHRHTHSVKMTVKKLQRRKSAESSWICKTPESFKENKIFMLLDVCVPICVYFRLLEIAFVVFV